MSDKQKEKSVISEYVTQNQVSPEKFTVQITIDKPAEDIIKGLQNGIEKLEKEKTEWKRRAKELVNQEPNDVQVRRWKNAATRLWKMLDMIDSAPDQFRPDSINKYRHMATYIDSIVQQRHRIMETDGYDLFFNFEEEFNEW